MVSGSLTYSCATPLPAGEGNIAADPRFMNPAADDFRLRFDSPCIDTGAMLDYPPDATDVAGLPRVLDGNFDFTNMPPWTVVFKSSTARVYTLLGRTNLLTEAWQPVTDAGPRPGVGGADSFEDDNDPPEGPCYCLKVELP